ncbi:hypothetical protein D922_02453 [Enterococcus faecalis 06-MB-DW-09]|nr:hypothetical protein D922_02453 [Enterococcus faecalis 06-MB-DW-09]
MGKNRGMLDAYFAMPKALDNLVQCLFCRLKRFMRRIVCGK